MNVIILAGRRALQERTPQFVIPPLAMRITSRLKSFLSSLAKRHGYRVERIVDYGDKQLNVFDLLIDRLDPRNPDFFFVQVGANDGRTGDPIHKFVRRYNWRGLLLEPQPDVFKTLAENYRDEPQLILENVALAHQDGSLPLFTVAGSSYLASFDRAALVSRVRDPAHIVEIRAESTTFRTLVDGHGIRRVDLLIVDTEGFDYEVIKLALRDGLPLPRLVRYEHLHLSSVDRKACADLLASHSYRLLRDGTDTIAYREAP